MNSIKIVPVDDRCINNIPPADYDLDGGFVGRKPEIKDIKKRLYSDLDRIITIMGAGGVGKTALALEVAKSIIDDPKNPDLKLIGRKRGGREIDVISYKGENIYVIDCKKWGLVPLYFYEHKKKGKIGNIEDEFVKQEERIKYIKNNMKKLGFDPKKYKNIKNVIVLEYKGNLPISKYKSMKIISLSEIANLK